MKALPKKPLILIAIGLVVAYVVLCIVMYARQRDLIYLPDTSLKDPAAYGLSMAQFSVPAEDGVKIVIWYRPAKQGNRTAVFFPGNAGNLGGRAEKFKTLIAEGYGLLAVSYRGYGTSEGRPTEAGLYADARAAITWLVAKGVQDKDMILYGESLGAAVAVKMATEFPKAAALLLEAPFTSLAAAGQVRYPYLPVALLLKDRFDSLARIGEVKTPLLIVHGVQDEVVPVEQGIALADAANEPKSIVQFPGSTHSNIDVPSIIIALKSFVALHIIVPERESTPLQIRFRQPGEMPKPVDPEKLKPFLIQRSPAVQR